MIKHCLAALFCAAITPFLVSCALPDAELAALFSPDYNPQPAGLSFKRNDILEWDTGAGKGTMKVLSVCGGKFTLEQRNEKNRQAEEVQMSGEIFADGTCRLENPAWNEVWTGNLNGNTLVGKVNNLYDFRITWKVPSYMSHSVKSVSKLPFSKGDVVKWSYGGVRGTMKIVSMKGDDFSVDKFDDFDKKKKAVRMGGSLSPNGACILRSVDGKEVWNGKLDGNTITGKINNGYNFKISRSNSVWDLPFETGGSLTWSAASRKGTIKVHSVTSTGKFVFDVYPSRATRIKETSLDGEIMGDGTYKMVNRKNGEVWIGRRDGSEIAGKINNTSKFVVGGLL